jgi:hypothetical protein
MNWRSIGSVVLAGGIMAVGLYARRASAECVFKTCERTATSWLNGSSATPNGCEAANSGNFSLGTENPRVLWANLDVACYVWAQGINIWGQAMTGCGVADVTDNGSSEWDTTDCGVAFTHRVTVWQDFDDPPDP